MEVNNSYVQMGLSRGSLDERLISSFARLPQDAYMSDGDNYRYRAFCQGIWNGKGIAWIDDRDFFQSENVNAYIGGVKRVFEAVSQDAKLCIEELLRSIDLLQGNGPYQVGCHQIRIVATRRDMGLPAPEGFHKDGFDYVMVACINCHNAYGGLTMLRAPAEDDNGEEIRFSGTLSPGMALLFDDRAFEHYTTPITHLIPGDGHRDVLVFTFKSMKGPAK